MPIPKVQGNENEDTFISRCISQIIDEYGQEQAAGICYGVWRESKMSSQERMINKMNKTQMELEGACWPGYIQIGTKIKNGKEVPDCRGPIE